MNKEDTTDKEQQVETSNKKCRYCTELCYFLFASVVKKTYKQEFSL